MTRRRLPVVAALALALVAPPGAGGADAPLAKRLARALVVPHVAQARTGAVAIDLQTGETVFAEHDGLPLVPASNEKLAVAYAAFATLGAGYRIETDVLGRGEQVGNVWRGSLVLVGHGDPTLSSADLVALARQVRATGIRRVTRGIVGDESFFDARRAGAGWKSWFYVNECPPLSALTVDRGRYYGHTARNPALAGTLLFRNALRRVGISVGGAGTGRMRADDVPLGAVASAPLSEIVRWMGRVSDNFTAELLLKQLGTVDGGLGTSARGAAVVRTALTQAGVPLAGVKVVDGSGLSSLDRLTTRALAALLRAVWADPEIRPYFIASLPVAGIRGTLADRMRRPPARGNVFAKTGTTSLASALSGYVKGRYVFSVLQNGSPVSSYWARRAQDRFATALAGQ
jgi:D-alanyl-D-alanine carboxypeptidase/D-alanyl-D-alanine-endopeptidase (penicillin-binding protein 4)